MSVGSNTRNSTKYAVVSKSEQLRQYKYKRLDHFFIQLDESGSLRVDDDHNSGNNHY